ncbi:MAG: GAF domain-containing protein [Terriglobia bacterium]
MNAQGTAGVARVVAELVKGKTELDRETAVKVAEALAKNFAVKTEDVSILRLMPGGRQLEFIVPEKLSKVGTIPLTSTKALAVRTVRGRKGEFINKFSAAEHHTVFEAVPLSKEGAQPIQKILCVPVLAKGKTTGVIQVTRKGKTPGTAGPDFTNKDMDEVRQIAAALAPCFPQG